jgi:glycosyltransferase involved in cell wall biosynthesis
MKALHVIPSLDPASGGPVEVLRQLRTIFSLGGHQVDVATLDSPEVARKYEFPARVFALGPSKGIYRYTPVAIPWLKANVAGYDLVVIHCVWQYSALAAYRALEGFAIPYAVFTHGMLDPYFKKRCPFKHLKKTIYWHGFLRKILCDADVVLFTSEEERLLARETFSRYKVRETVMPLGSFGPSCDTAAAREEFLVRWPHLRGKRLALSLGRIHPKKAIDVVIGAFAGTLANDPAWHLVIAGPDEAGHRKELETLAAGLGLSSRITWTGMLQGDLKWGSLLVSEILVMPSHQENFGMVVVEALACSLPVILSNKVNIWREVLNCSAGYIGEDTVEATKASLSRWSALTAEEIAVTRNCARKCFHESFNLNVTSKKILQVFETLIQRTAREKQNSLTAA